MSQNREQRVADYRSDYATRADFCQAFVDDANRLFLLAFLLTTNHVDAERCFVLTVYHTFNPNSVFKGWVTSWIRRTLITCAIAIVFGAFERDKRKPDRWCVGQNEISSAMDAITRLADLDRFVFVMSILEHYSVHECSLLLSCAAGTVVESRKRALQDLPALNNLGAVLDASLLQ
jgi:hypothetical protein